MVCGALAVAGCTVGPKYKPPVTAAPASFKELVPQQSPDGTLWKPAAPQDTASRGNWWEIYSEPELNELENKLNSSNQTIAQSYQNFAAARALVRQARSNYYPTIGTNPSYTRARNSVSLVGDQGNPNSNSFDLPFSVSWEPDVWGKVRSTVRQYANQAQASAADLANVRLSQQANLAVYYFELRGQDSLIALYQQTVEAYSKSLALTKKLNATGIDSAQDVAEANLSLQTAQSTLINLRIARAQYEHAIAVLIGEPAPSFSLPVRELTTAAPLVPAGVPSELLERRPDIAGAERTMSAANALIDVQTTAFYPSFSISGTAGFQSDKIGNWLTWPSRFFSIGPSASFTIFDAGARRAVLANYKAQYEADAAAYRQTVLTAFQQTEDSLAAQHYLADQLKQQQAAVDAAQKYLDLSNVRFRSGIDSYLNVYTAQTSLLTQQQTFIDLRVSQMTSNVQLIEDLGGGWNVDQLPSEKQVAAK
ncbi:MAG TPA: efflux transporter outer membrane subunit [Dongiaceae bacterium]|nr:efflux transporter outer membrane subunit [Dongiaceae bacterium]